MGRRKAPRAKASSGGGGGGGGGERRRPARAAAQPPHNFLPEAGAGCHIAHLDAPWIVGLDTCVRPARICAHLRASVRLRVRGALTRAPRALRQLRPR
jgi:hypothetical protein